MLSIRIYTLTDPRTNQVFYVGASKQDDRTVVTRHLGTCGYFGIRRDLKKAGLRPIIDTVDSTDNIYEVSDLETYWIWQFKAWGFNLENMRMCSAYTGSSKAYGSTYYYKHLRTPNPAV